MENQKQVVKSDHQVDLTNPSDTLAFAKEIKKIVVEGRLYDTIQGKNYVNVEGWQLAGALVGYSPLLTSLDDLSDGKCIKYRASVDLVKSDGTVIGRGVAICSNAEAKKRNFDEYAIASMAQTRATGKAFRLSIGWLMKLAGYEPTPAEEMEKPVTRPKKSPDVVNHNEAVEAVVVDDTPEVDVAEITEEPEYSATDEAIARIKACDTIQDLMRLWLSEEFKDFRGLSDVYQAKDARKAELVKGSKNEGN